MKAIHSRLMINLLRKTPIFLFIVASLLFLAQTTSGQNTPKEPTGTGIGGAYEDEIAEVALSADDAVDMGWTITDSLANIPAYDTYCHWDTRNLFLHKEAKEYVVDTMNFTLCRESCDFNYPVHGVLTSDFGQRGDRFHYGVDIDLETGDAVSAAFEGLVRISMYHASYGNVIVIRHNNGLETLYAHLSRRDVKSGDHVEAGEKIGQGGNTGRSFGSHLHFEVRYLGEPINPNEIIDVKGMQLRDWEFALTGTNFEYPKTAPAGTTGSRKYHVIRSGDTLTSIASKYGTTVPAICKLNGISKQSVIRAGKKLRVR